MSDELLGPHLVANLERAVWYPYDVVDRDENETVHSWIFRAVKQVVARVVEVVADREAQLAQAQDELVEARGLLQDAEKLILNTGPWDDKPGDEHIADWVLDKRTWCGEALPNVTEVVEIRG